MNAATAAKSQPVVIKKYANRRLYDTGTSAYITLEDLCTRVKEGKDFVVVDAKTGQDLTRQVLTQIILEQETKGFKILPTSFLRDVIQHYDTGIQEVFQGYLETSMKSFVNNQERIRSLFAQTPFGQGFKAMEGMAPFAPLEEITRQNMAMFEKAMQQMFNPFGAMFGDKDAPGPEAAPKSTKS
ncbi:MAG: polyhydroxyalkanoate synthesis repressor PhaR [Proteobacteria bacterium]|nr:polyhydroxyalkanoate synthesis repressor PhaR [Pseudomonadota bacterium]